MRTRLVLVHGSRVSGVQWQAHRRWLEPEFEVLTPDLPGHGRRAAEQFSMPAAIAAVAEAVEAPTAAPHELPIAASTAASTTASSAADATATSGGLGGQPPVVLVGHSLGGYVAMEYAAAYPDRLAGLVTIGAAAIPRGAGAAAYRLLGWVTERAGRDRITRINDRMLTRMAAPEVFAAIHADGYWFDGVRPSWAAVMSGGEPALLTRVRCPVLVVRGQFDQLGADGPRYAAAAARGRLLTVRGASHLLPLTRPWQTCAIVAEFARSVGDCRC